MIDFSFSLSSCVVVVFSQRGQSRRDLLPPPLADIYIYIYFKLKAKALCYPVKSCSVALSVGFSHFLVIVVQ